jgi:tetratricopeptide (TPR) repeat protein
MSLKRIEQADAFYQEGVRGLRAGKFAEAVTLLRLAIGIDPEHADAHPALCLAAHEAGEHDLLQITAIKLLDLPNKGARERAAAVSHYDCGFYEDAITAIEESIQLYPNEALSYYILGRSQLALFKFKEAQASFLKAYELASDFAVARSLLTWLATYLSVDESERIPLLMNVPRVPMHQPPPDIRDMTKYPFTQDSLDDLYGNVSLFYGAGNEI